MAMNLRKKVFLWLALGLSLPRLSFGLERGNLLFYLPFENSLAPAVARGHPEIRRTDFVFPFKGSFSNMDAAVGEKTGADEKKIESRTTFVPGRKGLGLKVTDNPDRSKVYSYPVVQYLAGESFSRREGAIICVNLRRNGL